MLPSRSALFAVSLAFACGFGASWAYREPPRKPHAPPGVVRPGTHIFISHPRTNPASGRQSVRLSVKRAVRCENGCLAHDPPLPPGSPLPCESEDWIIDVAGNSYLAGPAD